MSASIESNNDEQTPSHIQRYVHSLSSTFHLSLLVEGVIVEGFVPRVLIRSRQTSLAPEGRHPTGIVSSHPTPALPPPLSLLLHPEPRRFPFVAP